MKKAIANITDISWSENHSTFNINHFAGGRSMGCPAPGVPMSGSMQRNKMFGAIGGGVGVQPNFMQHGGNNVAAQYMQNKLQNKQQGPTPGNHFGMVGAKPLQPSIDSIGNEDNIHQVG